MKTLFFTLTVLAIAVIGASSLKCYICNNVVDKKCGHGSDVDEAFLQECNTTIEIFKNQLPAIPHGINKTYTLCRKMVTTIDFDVNENKAGERIKRTCGWDDTEEKYNEACYYRGGLGGRINVCSCKESKCNGSNTLKMSYLLPLILAFSCIKALA